MYMRGRRDWGLDIHVTSTRAWGLATIRLEYDRHGPLDSMRRSGPGVGVQCSPMRNGDMYKVSSSLR